MISNRQRYAILLAIHGVSLPVYAGMSPALLIYIALLSIWLFFIIKQQTNAQANDASLPGVLIRLLLIISAAGLLLDRYNTLFGREPGTALVVLMTLLKMLELRSRRDAIIILYACIFILATHFFQSQQPWMAVYVFTAITGLLALLISISDELQQISASIYLKTAARFVLLSLPFMLVLFILFPRIPGPLWGLPEDAFSPHTGLSEEMSPGSINRLISSSAIAMRVKFQHAPPPHSALYWRGIVLSQFDGKTWHRNDAPTRTRLYLQHQSAYTDLITYTVTLEPHQLDWLLSLDHPVQTEKAHISREGTLVTRSPVNRITNYKVVSDTHATNRSLFEWEALKYIQLPPGYNPQARKFALQLLKSSQNNASKYVQNTLNYFRQQPFYYTLLPPKLGKHTVDDFLFRSRRGFCEHYAGSFTFLMRAAGIPARVVIGYMGGEINPVDNYMEVRQSDAHAWTEVWLDGYWHRIDPTAAVAPDRIEKGVLNAGLESDQLPLMLLQNNAFLKQARYFAGSLQNSWNQWIIGFNQQKQKTLLSSLGMKNTDRPSLILWMVFSMTFTGLLVAAWLLHKKNRPDSRLQHYYAIFCQKLAKHGLPRKPGEGPQDYENRLYGQSCESHRFDEADMAFILKTYRYLHYGKQCNKKLEKLLVHKIRRFRVRSPLWQRVIRRT